MSRRKAGAIAVIPIAALVLWGVSACRESAQLCAAPSPTPALRMQPATPVPSRTPAVHPPLKRGITPPVRTVVPVRAGDDCD